MPQGYKNSLAIFQIIMDGIFKEKIDKACNVYLDNIVVYDQTEEKHGNNPRRIFIILQIHNIKINLNKIRYKQQAIKLLSAIIDGEAQRPIFKKQKQIIEFTRPATVKQMQRFLGFANYYPKYIPGLATIAAPLYKDIKRQSNIIS